MIGNLEILLGIIIALLYYYLVANFNFWRKLGVPGPQPTLFFGTLKDVFLSKMIFGKYLMKLFDEFENASLIGIFKMREPILIVKDFEFIKDVLIRDSGYFNSRGISVNIKREPLHQFLFFTDGKTANFLRTKFSPTFTPSKLKDAFNIMLKSVERLENYLDGLLLEDDKINFSDLSKRLSADMAGSALMSINMETLTRGKNEECDFLKYLALLVDTYWGIILREIIKTVPQLYKLFGFKNVTKSTEYYVNFTRDIIKHREEHNIVKSDFLGLLMEIRKNPKELIEILGRKPEDSFFAAQVFGFFFGSHETATTTITNMIYELAMNPSMQDRLRKEIYDTTARNNGKLQYEDLNEMPYLNAVFKETLRRYPAADVIQRQSNEKYTFKNTGVTIPKHQKIYIPLYAIHFNPKIYSKPYVFNPDRFLDRSAESRDSKHFIPFGDGIRHCIGERLGYIQSKLAVSSIIQKYKVEICEQTNDTEQEFNFLAYVKFSDKKQYFKTKKIN